MEDPLDVIHLDNHLLVVNKPPGLLVQADRTGDVDLLTLARDYLKQRFDKPGKVFIGLVHRLDRPVSGLVVLARTSKAAARLSDQFRRRIPEKDYLAIVEGSCRGAGLAEDYLKEANGGVMITDEGEEGARRASLQWRALGQADGLSLVAVKLQTGRKHQIRLQLAHLGHPILGDVRYGAKRELDGRNIALHAYRLSLTHPTRKEWITWTAAPPRAWSTPFRDAIEELITSE